MTFTETILQKLNNNPIEVANLKSMGTIIKVQNDRIDFLDGLSSIGKRMMSFCDENEFFNDHIIIYDGSMSNCNIGFQRVSDKAFECDKLASCWKDSLILGNKLILKLLNIDMVCSESKLYPTIIKLIVKETNENFNSDH